MKLGRKSAPNEVSGFLEHGTSVTGELRFSGTLRVDGSFHGSITTSDVLIIGERAILQADIKAGEVQVYGTVIGNIDCERRVEIRATGRVRGEIRAPQLIIEEGGGFEGTSRSTAEAPEDQPIDAESMSTAVSH